MPTILSYWELKIILILSMPKIVRFRNIANLVNLYGDFSAKFAHILVFLNQFFSTPVQNIRIKQYYAYQMFLSY